MKVWQIHSGPYSIDDDQDECWLVAKVESDEGDLIDMEIAFKDMESAIRFKNRVDLAFDPVEIIGGILQ